MRQPLSAFPTLRSSDVVNTQVKARGNGASTAARKVPSESYLRALFEAPLMREMLANALVAAAGAAAATLVRQRPDSSDRVASVAAAASSMTEIPSREELAQNARRALGELIAQVAKSAVPGVIAAVSGVGSGESRGEEDPAAEPTRGRKPPPRRGGNGGPSDWK